LKSMTKGFRDGRRTNVLDRPRRREAAGGHVTRT
jgi:hypothetical protein